MEKLYCGKGKEGKYGVKVSLCLNDLMAYAESDILPASNGKKYINIDVTKMREVDKWGNEYTVTIDTWKKPEKLESQVDSVKPMAEYEDIPF